MNTVLLRAARRHPNGARYWAIPGFGNAAKLSPARHTVWNAPAFSWPCDMGQGELTRAVRLDWHRSIAKAEARKLIAHATKLVADDFTHLPYNEWAELQAAHYSATEVNSWYRS